MKFPMEYRYIILPPYSYPYTRWLYKLCLTLLYRLSPIYDTYKCLLDSKLEASYTAYNIAVLSKTIQL